MAVSSASPLASVAAFSVCTCSAMPRISRHRTRQGGGFKVWLQRSFGYRHRRHAGRGRPAGRWPPARLHVLLLPGFQACSVSAGQLCESASPSASGCAASQGETGACARGPENLEEDFGPSQALRARRHPQRTWSPQTSRCQSAALFWLMFWMVRRLVEPRDLREATRLRLIVMRVGRPGQEW
jgi:hypothetical protein